MPCIPIKDGKHTGWLCIGGPFYFYKGFYFENREYFGPVKLNKDGTGSARCGTKFWNTVQEWRDLPSEEQEKYRIED